MPGPPDLSVLSYRAWALFMVYGEMFAPLRWSLAIRIRVSSQHGHCPLMAWSMPTHIDRHPCTHSEAQALRPDGKRAGLPPHTCSFMLYLRTHTCVFVEYRRHTQVVVVTAREKQGRGSYNDPAWGKHAAKGGLQGLHASKINPA